jgi:hypothetical protein
MRGRVPRGTANSRGTGEAGGGGVPERGFGGWTSGLGFRRLRRSRWGNSWRKGSTWNSGSPAGGKGTEPVGMREVDGWLSDRDMFHVERARPGGKGWGPRRPGPADGGKALRGRVPRGTRGLLRWEGQGVFRLGPWRWMRGFQARACSTWNVLARGQPLALEPAAWFWARGDPVRPVWLGCSTWNVPSRGAGWAPPGSRPGRCGKALGGRVPRGTADLFCWMRDEGAFWPRRVPRGTCRPGGEGWGACGVSVCLAAGRFFVGVFHVEQRSPAGDLLLPVFSAGP